MSEVMHQQTQEVMQQMHKQREYTPAQAQAIDWKVSKAHKSVIDRVDTFIAQECDRIEREIEQLEQQLLEKLAEQRELHAWCYQIGYRTGLQASVEIDLEEKGGENRE